MVKVRGGRARCSASGYGEGLGRGVIEWGLKVG